MHFPCHNSSLEFFTLFLGLLSHRSISLFRLAVVFVGGLGCGLGCGVGEGGLICVVEMVLRSLYHYANKSA